MKRRSVTPIDDPAEVWRRYCDMIRDDVLECGHEAQGNAAVEGAQELLQLAHRLKGVACPECGGRGRRVYSSTATWQGGMGGASYTEDVCDRCWGSGRTDETGPDLRQIRSRLRAAEASVSRRWFEERVGAGLRSHLSAYGEIAGRLRRARWSGFWVRSAAEAVAAALEELSGERDNGQKH